MKPTVPPSAKIGGGPHEEKLTGGAEKKKPFEEIVHQKNIKEIVQSS
ncbi:MAG TPA: hypothetical protein VF184_01475 [Phycisphaeraceae bacterium]